MKDREDGELRLSFSQAWVHSHTVLGFIGERGERELYWGSPCTHPGRLQYFMYVPKFLVDILIVGNQSDTTSPKLIITLPTVTTQTLRSLLFITMTAVSVEQSEQ